MYLETKKTESSYKGKPIYKDWYANPQTLEVIRKEFGFEWFRASELHYKLERASINISLWATISRLNRLNTFSYLKSRRAIEKTAMVVRYWALSKNSEDYLKKHGSFMNEDGMLVKIAERNVAKHTY